MCYMSMLLLLLSLGIYAFLYNYYFVQNRKGFSIIFNRIITIFTCYTYTKGTLNDDENWTQGKTQTYKSGVKKGFQP